MKKIITMSIAYIMISVLALSLTGCNGARPAAVTTQEPAFSANPELTSPQPTLKQTQTNSDAAGKITPGNAGNKGSNVNNTSSSDNNAASNNSSSGQNGIPPTSAPSAAPVQSVPKNKVRIAVYGPVNTENNVIIPITDIDYKDGMTVLDVLYVVCEKNNMSIDVSGMPGTKLVTGINDLSQFDFGTGSGWEYAVNGKFAYKSCDSFSLKGGDNIEWRYTRDLGKDIDWNLQ